MNDISLLILCFAIIITGVPLLIMVVGLLWGGILALRNLYEAYIEAHHIVK